MRRVATTLPTSVIRQLEKDLEEGYSITAEKRGGTIILHSARAAEVIWRLPFPIKLNDSGPFMLSLVKQGISLVQWPILPEPPIWLAGLALYQRDLEGQNDLI